MSLLRVVSTSRFQLATAYAITQRRDTAKRVGGLRRMLSLPRACAACWLEGRFETTVSERAASEMSVSALAVSDMTASEIAASELMASDMTASMKNNPHAGQNRTPGQALFREPAVAEPIQFDALGAT